MKFNLESHVLKLNTLILKYNVMTDPRKGARSGGGGRFRMAFTMNIEIKYNI